MESRQDNFAQGQQALGIHPTLTAGLQAASARQNVSNPRTFKANGLNQPYMMDPSNGNSATDASRQTPSGQLPSANGMSASTYHAINPNSYGISLNI